MDFLVAVQCHRCFKWRIIPSKERYAEIRENILEVPFFCEHGREWKPELSCEVVADVEHDGRRPWGIDAPNVPLPPPGWERRLILRGITTTRLADVYYYPPSGRQRLRSKADIRRYLDQNPGHREGISLEMFCFKIPKLLEQPAIDESAEATEDGDIEAGANELGGSSSDEEI